MRGTGEVWPATCVGISVGNALTEPIGRIWERLAGEYASMPVVAALSEAGPERLLQNALQNGFTIRETRYASKCQLCFDVRSQLRGCGELVRHLAPETVYAGLGGDGVFEPA